MVQDGIYYALEEVNKRLEAENKELREQALELKEQVEKLEKEKTAQKAAQKDAMNAKASTKPVTSKRR